jgi:uncharacterized membrane protein affecting hemolysin expression
MAESRPIPLWALLMILVLFAIFTVNSLFSAHMELNRRTRDEWLRQEIIHQQAEQNTRLMAIRAQVEQSIHTLDLTLHRLMQTQKIVETTQEKVDAATRTLEVISDKPNGLSSEPRAR